MPCWPALSARLLGLPCQSHPGACRRNALGSPPETVKGTPGCHSPGPGSAAALLPRGCVLKTASENPWRAGFPVCGRERPDVRGVSSPSVPGAARTRLADSRAGGDGGALRGGQVLLVEQFRDPRVGFGFSAPRNRVPCSSRWATVSSDPVLLPRWSQSERPSLADAPPAGPDGEATSVCKLGTSPESPEASGPGCRQADPGGRRHRAFPGCPLESEPTFCPAGTL